MSGEKKIQKSSSAAAVRMPLLRDMGNVVRR